MPNQRRLDLLLAEFMREQANGSVRVHPPIKVLSQWVESTLKNIQWLNGEATNRRADPHQLAQVWQRAWPDPDGSLSDNEKHIAARQAIAAERLIQQWYPNAFEEAGEAGHAFSSSGPWLDSRFFTARQVVKRQQASGNWSTTEDITAQLIGLLESGVALPFAAPEKITCQGFHEWTHLEQRLLSALQHRGVEVATSSPALLAATPPTAQPELHSYANPELELHAAAQWAKERAQAMDLQGSSGQISVVIHGLNRAPSIAGRIFEKAFCNEHEFFIADRANADFYLPYGEPLSASPLIQDALMLLQLAHGGPRKPIAFPTISRLLLSPAWADAAEERNSRARLELDLRQHSAYYISLSSLLEQARRHKTRDELTQCIDVIREAMDTDWQEPGSLEFCLRRWGWPGSGATSADVAVLNSLVSRFSSLLERAQNLDDCSLPERLNILRRMCAETEQGSFGGPLSRVLLLTPEDAVGQRFDAAWVVGLHAGNWPGQPLSNPFLPANVTKKIPRASAAGELAWCEVITAGLKTLAPEILFSWTRQVDDVPQAPSPLLLGMAPVEHKLLAGGITEDDERADSIEAEGAWSSYANHPWLEEVADGQGRALAPDEAIKGGAGTISDQSASPLAAYLKHRLAAKFVAMPEPFAAAAWRGQLLHRALHALYVPVLGQTAVPQDAAIPGAIETAMQSMQAWTRLSPIQYQAEYQRLQRLLGDWLELERQRPAFRVLAVEQQLDVELLGHALHLRIDRVDQIAAADGESGDKNLLVIDYKSGTVSLAGWTRERLEEPQLPLYSMVLSSDQSGDQNVAGLALASVRFGEIKVQGIVADADCQFSGVRSFGTGRDKAAIHRMFQDWSEALQSWSHSISQIAGEYIAGDARNLIFNEKHYTVQELAALLRLEEGAEWQRQRQHQQSLLGTEP